MKIIITENQFKNIQRQDRIKQIVEDLWQQGYSMEEIPNYIPIPFWQVVTILKDHDMEIDCKMVENLLRKLFQKTSLLSKEVITDEFGLYLSYSSFEGAIEYEFNDEDCLIIGYATPYWNGECSLPIENITYNDKKEEEEHDFEPSKTIKLPERFDSMGELIEWFNNEYIKYLIQTIKEFKKDF
jgi:hypothetical protein